MPFMLSIYMLSVVILSVVIPNVVAPKMATWALKVVRLTLIETFSFISIETFISSLKQQIRGSFKKNIFSL